MKKQVDLEAALPKGWEYGAWSPSKEAFAALIEALPAEPIVLEFGSGLTTKVMLDAGAERIVSFEHSDEFAAKTREIVSDEGRATLFVSKLKQLLPDQVNFLKYSNDPLADYEKFRSPLPVQEQGFRTPNLFYDFPFTNLMAERLAFNTVILDGPHGSGRIIAYPILKALLAGRKAIVLIDDENHYNFLYHFSQWFPYREIARNAVGDKHSWVIVEAN